MFTKGEQFSVSDYKGFCSDPVLGAGEPHIHTQIYFAATSSDSPYYIQTGTLYLDRVSEEYTLGCIHGATGDIMGL